MKHILTLASLLLMSSLFAQQDDFIQEYIERLENSKKYLILVAETMSEDNYKFKTTPIKIYFR